MKKKDLKTLRGLLMRLPGHLKGVEKYVRTVVTTYFYEYARQDDEDEYDEYTYDIDEIYFTLLCYTKLGDKYYKLDLFKDHPLINFSLDRYATIKPVNWYIIYCMDSVLVESLPQEPCNESDKDIMDQILAWFETTFPEIVKSTKKNLIKFKQSLADYLYHERLHLVVTWELLQPYIPYGNNRESEKDCIDTLESVLKKYPDDDIFIKLKTRPFSNEYTTKYVEGKESTIAEVELCSLNEDLVKEAVEELENVNEFLRDEVC